VQSNETVFTMEATLAILDIPEQRVKTGISHQYLRRAVANGEDVEARGEVSEEDLANIIRESMENW
jgi:hypothetical protein